MKANCSYESRLVIVTDSCIPKVATICLLKMYVIALNVQIGAA